MNDTHIKLPEGWKVVGPAADDETLYLLKRDDVALAGIRFGLTYGEGLTQFRWFGLPAAGAYAPWNEGGFHTLENAAEMAVRILAEVPRPQEASS